MPKGAAASLAATPARRRARPPAAPIDPPPLTLDALRPDPENRRAHPERNRAMLAESLRAVGAGRSIVIDEDGQILAGNGLVQAARSVGVERLQIVESDGATIVAVRRRGLSADEKRALALYDNRTAELAEWNAERLQLDVAAGLDLAPFFSTEELAAVLGSSGFDPSVSLVEQFGAPPFSVLDARQGYWQDRKREWLGLGLESEVGREGNLLKHNPKMQAQTGLHGTSIFDPVLCELMYRWFAPEGALVLDPFAGGSVRGIVAARLGRRYVGIELRPEQIASNEGQAARIIADAAARPQWIRGDARALAALPATAALECDFLFSCPPYFDLEVYSDDPQDLSAAGSYAEFRTAYAAIIAAAVARLRPHRFACFVVGDLREKGGAGWYRAFPAHTIEAFEAAGARLYNDAVLVTATGSLPMRVPTMFGPARKLGKAHQNVLIFCKGDPKQAVAALAPIVSEAEPEGDEDPDART